MARFFIDRPIFAWVIAIFIMGVGILSILTLPVAQYPQIAPPTVSVNAAYPGASADTVANTVTQVIEQQMTGLDGLRYISSNSTSSGSSSVTLTFETGTDPDIAQVQVQNKLAQATALLPEVVQRQGVTVQKSSSGFLMVIGLISEDGKLDATDLGDYLTTNLVNELSRVEGVGQCPGIWCPICHAHLAGSRQTGRIRTDPRRCCCRRLCRERADFRRGLWFTAVG
jgi:Cation/multidrug efflux pump